MIKLLLKLFNILYNCIIIKKNRVKKSNNLVINGRLYIDGKNITIGNNVKLNSGYKYNPIGGQERIILISRENGKIEIGNKVGISNSTIVSHNEVIIEDNVLIGGSCKIYDTDFHSIEFEKRMNKPDNAIKTKPIRIKEGAFVGAHSIILKGVTIGKYSIVGAGSVVTKSIPDGEIWAGNPARFIRKI